MIYVSLVIRNCVKVGILLSSVLAPLAVHAGKALLTRFIKGRRVRSCPHCGGKIFIRGKTRRK